MKFVHTYISTKSKVPTLSDIVKNAQTKAAMAAETATTKTASAQAPVKVAGEKGKGNPKNLTAPKFGKDKGETVEVEVEAEIVAPKKTKKASVKVAEDKDKDEADSSGQLDVEPLHQEGESTQEKPGKLDTQKKKASEGGEGKKGGESDEAESSGQLDVEPLHQKGESTQEKPGSLDTQKKGEEKKSGAKREWVKIANLTSEQKGKMREELEKFWPKKFVDALLADR